MKLCHNILALHNKSMSKKKVILIAVLMIYIYLSLSLCQIRDHFSVMLSGSVHYAYRMIWL